MPTPTHISATRRRQKSSMRVVHSLAGRMTAQLAARVRKKYGAILVRLLVWRIAAQTMHNRSASTAAIAIEPLSSARIWRGDSVTGSTTGIGSPPGLDGTYGLSDGASGIAVPGNAGAGNGTVIGWAPDSSASTSRDISAIER